MKPASATFLKLLYSAIMLAPRPPRFLRSSSSRRSFSKSLGAMSLQVLPSELSSSRMKPRSRSFPTTRFFCTSTPSPLDAHATCRIELLLLSVYSRASSLSTESEGKFSICSRSSRALSWSPHLHASQSDLPRAAAVSETILCFTGVLLCYPLALPRFSVDPEVLPCRLCSAARPLYVRVAWYSLSRPGPYTYFCLWVCFQSSRPANLFPLCSVQCSAFAKSFANLFAKSAPCLTNAFADATFV
mmetsp:Transcript_10075/g.26076  ORF Transcript_10075/g.26076 Transcript_10075/m.26076 type:complete len:244 (-) Transcript_10075:80-811(-)